MDLEEEAKSQAQVNEADSGSLSCTAKLNVGGVIVKALLDFGATACIVDESVARRMKGKSK